MLRQFGAKIKNFNAELLKNFIYEKIVESKSWNMASFFKGLVEKLNLEDIDEVTSIVTEFREKIGKGQGKTFGI